MKRFLPLWLALGCLSGWGATRDNAFTTNTPAVSTNVAASISLAIINVYTNGRVVGPSGAVDTTATTTAGINEAIHALRQGTTIGPQIGGGIIQLQPGDYFCSGSVTNPNSYAFNLIVLGSGEGASRIVHTGSVSNFWSNEKTDSGHGNTLQFVMKNVGLFYSNDTQKACLLRFAGANQCLFENCFFAPYQMLYQTNFANPLVFYTPPTNAVGTIGIRLDTGANRATFRNCYFHGLAIGLITGADHNLIDGCIFSDCGQWNSGSGNHFSTVYSTTSSGGDRLVQNFASYGIGLLCFNNTYEVSVNGGQWFNCHGAIGSISGGFGPQLTVYNPMFESDGSRVVASQSLLGDDPAPFLIIHGMSEGGSQADDVKYNASTGAVLTDYDSGDAIPASDIFLSSNIPDNGGFFFKGQNGTTNIWSFSGLLNGGNWFNQGGLAVGQDSGPLSGYSFEVTGNSLFLGTLTGNGSGLTNLTPPFVSFSNYTTAATARTMNTWSGKVKLSAGQSTYTVTDSLVTSAAAIIATLNLADATGLEVEAVPGSGSFTLNVKPAAVTSDTSISWFILSP